MTQNVIIGYSGHAFVVLEAANQSGCPITSYCERRKSVFNPYDIEYLGDESNIDFNWEKVDSFVLGIGDNKIRRKVAALILSKNKAILNIIHPSAIISNTAKFRHGIFISAKVTVNALASIDNFCILNTGCIIEHECKVGEAVHIAPGAILAGNVSVGENTFVGAGSVVRQGIKIGKNVVIGAGSVVVKDIPDGGVWVGNPAKQIK
ncbi:acetyltransferase [Soonwooa purpurea]